MVPVNGSSGVFLAARIDKTGCETYLARGLFFFLFPRDGLFLLTKDLGEMIQEGRGEGGRVEGGGERGEETRNQEILETSL